jgi:hypothetical protein
MPKYPFYPRHSTHLGQPGDGRHGAAASHGPRPSTYTSYYYQLPERVVYINYPAYAPGREPVGYQQWLRQQAPQVVLTPPSCTPRPTR